MLLFCIVSALCCALFFFFNDTATTEIYTLSLHDALPISDPGTVVQSRPSRARQISQWRRSRRMARRRSFERAPPGHSADRKSTRLNSSHGYISYAVFCLKKKKKQNCSSPNRLCITSLYHHCSCSCFVS